MILISHLNAFFSVISLCVFFSLLILLRLSMAKSKMSLGKCHVALENMWIFFSNIFSYWLLTWFHSGKRTDSAWFQDFQILKVLHLVLCSWICSSDSWFIVYGDSNNICVLLLCENCINLNNVEKNKMNFCTHLTR